MKNLVFYSGPHGSGKTTLISNLIQENIFLLENDFDINFLENFKTIKVMSDFERCLLRLYHRIYVQNYATSKIKKNKTILVSRSVYDSFAYVETYYQLGKISEKEFNIVNKIKDSYSDLPKTVILNPSVEIIMKRLKKRFENDERPERKEIFNAEDRIEFVSLLHDNFSKYKNDSNILYLENNEVEDRLKIKKWILEENKGMLNE
jgi:thymidylate kinase